MTTLFSFMLLLHTFVSVGQRPAGPSAGKTDLYFVVFLRPAPDRPRLAATEMDRIQTAHMANIHAMADRGVLVAAGPFEDTPTTISGLFLFKVASLDEARRIASADPTVVEHRNTVEVFAWRGPGGIGEEYKRLHAERPDTPEGMGVQPLFLMHRAAGMSATDAMLKAHTDYVDRLRTEGKIAATGLAEGAGDLFSMVVFNRIGDEEAARLVANDPAVKGGALRAEAHRWWCAEHVLPG
jgi:uncharacterized protein YciI